MKVVAGIIFLFISSVLGFGQGSYVYEFGNDEGEVIYTKDGTIGFYPKSATIDIPVPAGTVVNYVKVTADAFSSPKVDYDSVFHQISIKFAFTQISNCNYNVLVKGRRLH